MEVAMSQADKSHSTTPSKRVAGSADSSSKSINRRRLMIGGGAVGAAAAVAGVDVPAFEQSGPSELAALVHRYFDEDDAFNAWCKRLTRTMTRSMHGLPAPMMLRATEC